MKKAIIVFMVILSVAMMAGCSFGPEYCSVSGCPKEAARSADYCYQHKCSNYSCTNRAIDDYSYCMECIERAQ